MECPRCGYVMGPFDVECERCRRMGPPPEPEEEAVDAPQPPEQTGAAAPSAQCETMAEVVGEERSVAAEFGCLAAGCIVPLAVLATAVTLAVLYVLTGRDRRTAPELVTGIVLVVSVCLALFTFHAIKGARAKQPFKQEARGWVCLFLFWVAALWLFARAVGEHFLFVAQGASVIPMLLAGNLFGRTIRVLLARGGRVYGNRM